MPKTPIISNVNLQFLLFLHRDSTNSARSLRAFSENEILHSLPPEESERGRHLFDLALESLANFVGSHSLEVRFPSNAIDRAVEEGRTIKKKHMSALALAIALKALAAMAASKFCGGHKGGHYTEWINRVSKFIFSVSDQMQSN